MDIKEINQIEQPQYQSLKEGFDKYYASVLYPFLKNKEDIRIKYLIRFKFLILLSAFILPMISVLIYFVNHYYHKDIDWGILFIFLAVAVYLIRSPYARYRKLVKNDVMDLFIEYFDGFTYEGGKGLNEQEMRESKLFPHYDDVQADDCFRGTYANVGIRVCEEILKQETKDSKGRTHYQTVFQGIAVELEMNKNFSGQTIVTKDRGIFNAFSSYEGLTRVKLEDVIFEKIFEVYSNDQIEARYLLTTVFMERLLGLRELYQGKKIEVGFFNNKILIAIDTRQNMFEACSFFKTILNKDRFDQVFEQIWTIFSIIHVSKLNEKTGL